MELHLRATGCHLPYRMVTDWATPDCLPSVTAFPVAAARVWNSLPDLVTSAPSVAVFRSRLKTHLFNISYPSPLWLYSVRAVTPSCFGHFNRSSLLTYLLTYLHRWTHSVLTPAKQAGTRFTYPEWDGRLSWLRWLVTYRDGYPPTDGHPPK